MDVELTVVIVIVGPWIDKIRIVSMTEMLIRKSFDHFLRVEVSAYFVNLTKEIPAAPSF